MLKNLPPVGLRTFKTLLATIICVIIMEYVFNETPFFACIGAVVAVEKTLETSIKASISRNTGTIIGGVLGIIFASISVQPVFLALGIVPLIYIKNLIKKQDSIVAGAIVYFAVVFLNPGGQALLYGTRRIAGTFFGTLIGFAVNYFISSPKNTIEAK